MKRVERNTLEVPLTPHQPFACNKSLNSTYSNSSGFIDTTGRSEYTETHQWISITNTGTHCISLHTTYPTALTHHGPLYCRNMAWMVQTWLQARPNWTSGKAHHSLPSATHWVHMGGTSELPQQSGTMSYVHSIYMALHQPPQLVRANERTTEQHL